MTPNRIGTMQENEKHGLSKDFDNFDLSIKLLGYCEKSIDSIGDIIRSGRVETLTELDGEFTIVYHYIMETGIITSRIGAIHYYYYYNGNQFYHGDQTIDIIKAANIQWLWDWESVGDLCDLENLTGNRTLHSQIRRVPAGSVLRVRESLLLRSSSLLDKFKVSESNPVDAIDIFNQETKRWASPDPYLSLSGGFDSRVILSSMLRQNIYPKVVTLGNEDTTDIQVASQIASKFGLRHIRITLALEDFLQCGEHVATITNGTKPACHWHTYLYPRKAGVPKDQTFFVGTLGEFARSYYFDKGFISLMAEGCSSYFQEKFWLLKLSRHRTFRESELTQLCDPLKNQINKEGTRKRAKRNAQMSTGEFLSGGTRYYLEQRVPNFYANGIRMYNDTSLWRSPFHNIKWLETIWNLNDNWKLGSNWHRLAIKRNYPELLGFPEEKGLSRTRMLSKAPPLYWLPTLQRKKYETYDLSQTWYRDNRIQSLLLDSHYYLDTFIEKRLTESIINEHRMYGTRTKAISFLLTLFFFQRTLTHRA